MSEILTNQDRSQESATIAHNFAHNRDAKKESEEVITRYPKTDARYWRPRVLKNLRTNDGQKIEDAHYSIQVMHEGRREWFNTDETDRRMAAAKAANIFRSLTDKGWEATLKSFKPGKVEGPKPDPNAPKMIDAPTVGQYLKLVEQWAGLSAGTYAGYTRLLRLIVGDISKLKKTAKRYNAHAGGGRAKWCARVDAISLAAITPAAVQKWRLDFLKRAKKEPTAQARAKVSCNSMIGQAKALFSKRVLKLVSPHLQLPSPLPFHEVEKFTKLRSHMRYQSKVDAFKILKDARTELGESKPEHFKILVLAVCCGMRRNEIDKLTWNQVDLDAAVIRIETTRYFKAKSDDSNAAVDVEPEIVALMRAWRERAKSEFVVESDIKPRVDVSYKHYRCEPILEELIVWLRSKGVDDLKPLHTMRKEFGSIVTEKMGIYAASRALRHADIQVTALHYVDKKQRIATGLGAVLTPSNVTTADFAGAGKARKARRAKAG